jgi:ParB/RepB/Spo0J family partition protein
MPEQIENIDVKLLIPSFVLLRLVDKTSLDYIEMRDSIQAHGFFSAVCVRKAKRLENSYEIIDGLHRYCCALDCGLTSIPCIIKDATDAEVKNWQLQAHLIRRETLQSEYAARLKMIFCENPDLTMETLAVELHCRPKKIRDILRLNLLIPRLQRHLDVGELPLTSAYALSRLPKQLQEDLLPKAMELSAREFIQVANGYSRAYREAVGRGRLDCYLKQAVAPQPHLRPFKAIREEYNLPTSGPLVIKEVENKTPIEIWKAALAWVLHLDPISIRRAQAIADKHAEKEKERLLRRKVPPAHQVKSNVAAVRLGIDPNDKDLIEAIL